MNSKYLIFSLGSLLLLLLNGCDFFSLPEEEAQGQENGIIPMEELQVPPSFNFSSSRSLQVEVRALDAAGKPMINIPVRVDLPVGTALYPLINGLTGPSGSFSFEASVDKNTEYLILKTPYPGFPYAQLMEVSGDVLYYEMKVGDANFVEGWNENERIAPAQDLSVPLFASDRNLSFSYFGSYNNQ
jgi:hypothetical protein